MAKLVELVKSVWDYVKGLFGESKLDDLIEAKFEELKKELFEQGKKEVEELVEKLLKEKMSQ